MNQLDEAVEHLATVIANPARLECYMFSEHDRNFVSDRTVVPMPGVHKNPPQSHTGAGGSVESG